MEWPEKETTTAAATNASKKRSKYGLSDEQTDEMLGDELEVRTSGNFCFILFFFFFGYFLL